MDIHAPTPDTRHLKRLHDMQSEYRALDYELGQASVLRTYPEHEREALRNGHGVVEVLPGSHARRAAIKKGMRPVIHWGRFRERTIYQANGVNLVYRREPGGDPVLVRAYRFTANGDAEVPLCQI